MIYLLMVGIYEVGIPNEWLQFLEAINQVIMGQGITYCDVIYMLVKSLLHGDVLQAFQNKKKNHTEILAQCLWYVLMQ
eukprot:458885-Ditylum_brightwellii.AAC.1